MNKRIWTYWTLSALLIIAATLLYFAPSKEAPANTEPTRVGFETISFKVGESKTFTNGKMEATITRETEREWSVTTNNSRLDFKGVIDDNFVFWETENSKEHTLIGILTGDGIYTNGWNLNP